MNDRHTVDQVIEVTLESGHGTITALARAGEGVPVVLVHGVMADASAWLPVVEAIAPGRPVLVLNRRGRAPSAPLNKEYDLNIEIRDLLLWLATLESPVDLVGHSYGGLIAVEAIRQGAGVRSLVLYEPVAHPFGIKALPLVTAAINAGDLDAAVEIINIDLSGYSHEHVKALRSSPAWPHLMRLAETASAELLAVNNFAFTAPKSWTIPTTIIAGEHSRNRPPYGPSVDTFMEALQLEDITILSNEDHLAHVTAPKDLAHAINHGLDRRP